MSRIANGRWPAAGGGMRPSWGAGCVPPGTCRTRFCALPPAGHARRGNLCSPDSGIAPPVEFDNGVYEGAAERLLELIRRARPTAGTLLVVGHDPAIPELALTLAATPAVQAGAVRDVAPSAVLERMRAKFPTAAVAVLELTGNWNQLTPGQPG